MESGRPRNASIDSTVPKSPESAKSAGVLPWMSPLVEQDAIPEIHIDRYELDPEKGAPSMADLLSRASIRGAKSEYPWMAGRSGSSLNIGLAPSLKESAQDFVADMRVQEGFRRSRRKEKSKTAKDGPKSDSDPENEGQWLSGGDLSPESAKWATARAKGKDREVSKNSYVDLKLQVADSSRANSLKSDVSSAATSPGLTEFSSSDRPEPDVGTVPIDLFTADEWVRFINMRKLYAVTIIMTRAVATILGFKADLPSSHETSMESALAASAKLMKLIEEAELRKRFQEQSCDPVFRGVLDVERTDGSLERLAYRLERWVEADVKDGVNV